MTDKDRTLVFGPDPRTYSRSDFTLLDLLHREGLSRVFLEESSLGVRNVAFESSSPKQTSGPVFPPHRLEETPRSTKAKPLFFSTASLANLREVLPCRREFCGLNLVVGLLLRYRDGRETSLGQVRLDCLKAPMSTSGRFSLWIGISRNMYNSRVVAIDFSRGSNERGIEWVEVRDDEAVEWWFSYENSEVFTRKLSNFERENF